MSSRMDCGPNLRLLYSSTCSSGTSAPSSSSSSWLCVCFLRRLFATSSSCVQHMGHQTQILLCMTPACTGPLCDQWAS